MNFLKKLILFPVIIFLMFWFYVFVHESAHVVVDIATGIEIEEFYVFGVVLYPRLELRNPLKEEGYGHVRPKIPEKENVMERLNKTLEILFKAGPGLMAGQGTTFLIGAIFTLSLFIIKKAKWRLFQYYFAFYSIDIFQDLFLRDLVKMIIPGLCSEFTRGCESEFVSGASLVGIEKSISKILIYCLSISLFSLIGAAFIKDFRLGRFPILRRFENGLMGPLRYLKNFLKRNKE